MSVSIEGVPEVGWELVVSGSDLDKITDKSNLLGHRLAMISPHILFDMMGWTSPHNKRISRKAMLAALGLPKTPPQSRLLDCCHPHVQEWFKTLHENDYSIRYQDGRIHILFVYENDALMFHMSIL